MKKMIVALIIALVLCIIATGCTQRARVSHNVSKEADNFNVTRHLQVVNTRTDKPIFELVGNFAISIDPDGDLNVICELENGTYKKHYVHLTENTVYVVEDLSGSDVTPYHYEINVLPQTFQTFSLKLGD